MFQEEKFLSKKKVTGQRGSLGVKKFQVEEKCFRTRRKFRG